MEFVSTVTIPLTEYENLKSDLENRREEISRLIKDLRLVHKMELEDLNREASRITDLNERSRIREMVHMGKL